MSSGNSARITTSSIPVLEVLYNKLGQLDWAGSAEWNAAIDAVRAEIRQQLS